jgi:hypothetical protein
MINIDVSTNYLINVPKLAESLDEKEKDSRFKCQNANIRH